MITKSKIDEIDISGLTDILSRIFGDTVWDDDAGRTAERWLQAMMEFAPGGEMPFKFTTFPAVANEMIVAVDIEFASLCAHHLFPYAGKCHVGYLPNELQVGISKIPRLVHWMAARPTSQEKLTHDVASFMKHSLAAQGVAVVIEATHTCMACRGIREHNASMKTSDMMGIFLTASEARNEFLTLVGRSK
jgi:GTP cyclohydrolase I